jgi:hypothetical protein
MKEYNVTFKENKKYNPATRTIKVKAEFGHAAALLVADEYDSINYKEGFPKPSNKKITILDVKEIDQRKEKIKDEE